ncbi:MAG: hypothetical protein ACOX6X_00660, partial [Dethiobacteria bacterium]
KLRSRRAFYYPVNRFQPTYEELKPHKSGIYKMFLLRFQPTYEELKLRSRRAFYYPVNRFQPTYEELKRGCNTLEPGFQFQIIRN